MLKGVAASTGIGIGRAVVLPLPDTFLPTHQGQGLDEELRRFDRGVDIFCTQLSRLAGKMARHFGQGEAAIITAQIILVRDGQLREEIAAWISARACNAEQAVAGVFDKYYRQFSAMEDEVMRARCADFKDMKLRLLRILTGREGDACREPPQGSVVVAEEISPSLAASILPSRVEAVATCAGNAVSHMAILARSLEIPTVVGAAQLTQRIREGQQIIVDGGSGEVILNPTPEQMERYTRRRQQQAAARAKFTLLLRREPATRDKKPVAVRASLSALEQLPDLLGAGADGVGFFSAEPLFREDAAPGEQQQFLAYRAIVRQLRGRPATISLTEAAPQPDMTVLRQRITQLTALLRASAFGNLRILLPMATSMEDLRRARELLERCKGELLRRQVDFDPNLLLGVSVETPAAALIAPALAKEADFFSISSRLVQHTLAGAAPSPLDVYHPAVLSLVQQTAQAANQAFIPVSVRGDWAADPMLLPFFVGCGIGEICAEPAALFGIRQQLGNLSYRFWQEQIPRILTLSAPGEVAAFIKDNWSEREWHQESSS